jgi:hypothetical protein
MYVFKYHHRSNDQLGVRTRLRFFKRKCCISAYWWIKYRKKKKLFKISSSSAKINWVKKSNMYFFKPNRLTSGNKFFRKFFKRGLSLLNITNYISSIYLNHLCLLFTGFNSSWFFLNLRKFIVRCHFYPYIKIFSKTFASKIFYKKKKKFIRAFLRFSLFKDPSVFCRALIKRFRRSRLRSHRFFFRIAGRLLKF